MQKPSPSFESAAPAPGNRNKLHPTTPARPWKKPADHPRSPKVYQVDPRGFRDLVQRLTGMPRRPAPRPPAATAVAPVTSMVYSDNNKYLMLEAEEDPRLNFYGEWGAFGLLDQVNLQGEEYN
ncbi:formin-like protein 5 [Canna indica]|uniref:Formin-like protein 5 n=1 Tax=Canna indica TaxID=4628 RepID=A0AAQ3JMM1_9LILI|nr:formin-like protein 5 [Canna indica]